MPAVLVLSFFYTQVCGSGLFHNALTGDFIQELPSLPPDTLRFKSSKDSLTAPVTYHADDSMIIDVPDRRIIFYGKKSAIKYQDNELTAPFIEFAQSSQEVSAYYLRDSSGGVLAYPEFMQGGMKSVSDTIRFNMRTMKGLTKGTYTQEGEMFIYGSRIKKISDDVFFGSKTRFTTCNLDTPHFAFVSNKVKIIRNKMAVTGLVHPEFEGVPLPVGLPFGLFPLSKGRHSGLMPPAFSANQQLGMALEGLGYYKVLNENWDFILQGTVYSYGGWTLSANPRYYRRYHYQGSFAYNMQHFKSGFKGDPDYVSSNTYSLRWSHSMDNKARPGVTFNANVNAASSKYNEQVPNNPNLNFTNQLSSSISYAKVWKDKPYNISVNANHNQNTRQRLINLNLPDVNFNLNTVYPFRRREPVGELKWYENVGLALNSNVRSLTSFYDTASRINDQIARNWQWGASHSIPVSLSLPPLGALQLSPNISYSQRWYQKSTLKQWNAAAGKLDTVTSRGFFAAHDISFGLSAATRIFGLFTFGPKSRVSAVRHEIRPSLSVNYKPDINGRNYYNAVVDTFGNTFRYSRFESSIFGPYGEGKFGGLSFGIDNNLQMKVRNRRDTGKDNEKKVSLIDGFAVNGAYNFLLDSFQLSNLSMSARSNLFDKISITGNASFDPYLYDDSSGRRINKLIWTRKALSLGTLMGGTISMSSSFRGGQGKKAAMVPGSAYAGGFSYDEYQQLANYAAANPAEFADFSIPWNIDFSYSLRFNKIRNGTQVSTQISQDVNCNASVNMTPRWKIGMNGFYNITRKELGTLSLFMSRELHCWQLSVTVSPVGIYKYFSINISPRSGLLQDLRINRTRYFYNF